MAKFGFGGEGIIFLLYYLLVSRVRVRGALKTRRGVGGFAVRLRRVRGVCLCYAWQIILDACCGHFIGAGCRRWAFRSSQHDVAAGRMLGL